MRFSILLLLMLGISVQSKKDEKVDSKHEMLTDPCSCALLNFWDIKPREDASTCCEALKELCYKSTSTLHCGHVYRFCLKRRAGYSAYILDEFVRKKLKHMGCEAFNPKATHEAEKCGGGYCRIGYTCETVNAEKCYADGGLVCGNGFCNNGAECAEMSSQTCKRFKKKKMEKLEKKGFDDAECKGNVCEACKTVTEYKCAFKSGLTEPCEEKGCARGRRCVIVPEEVCVIRPDAKKYLNGAETHAPEKVKKKFRRYTAFLLPAVGALVAAISVIAFISWATMRVRRARKEVGFDDSDNETPRGEKEKDVPLSPTAIKRPTFTQNAANLAHSVADILSPRLRVSTDHHPGYDESTPPRRRFTSRNYSTLEATDSMSDTER